MACNASSIMHSGLYRVFIQPVQRSYPRFLTSSSSLVATIPRSDLPRPKSTRRFSIISSHRLPVRPSFAPRPLQKPQEQAKRVPENESIGEMGYLVTEAGALGDPQRIRDILVTLDLSTSVLRQVGATETGTPVCKVFDRRQLRETERQAAKPRKTPETQTKQVEMTWAMSPHDLSYRFKRIEAFLAAGRRVEVMIARKRGAKRLTRSEAEEQLHTVSAFVKGLPGRINEYLPAKGAVGSQYTMYYENTAKPASEPSEDAKLKEQLDRRKQKDQEKIDRQTKMARRLEQKRALEDEKAKAGANVTITTADQK